MEIRCNTSSIYDIKNHLWRVSSLFIPALSTYVDIDQYAKKIYEKAQRIEFWNGSQLEGLLAYYCNIEGRYAFITNMSISSEFMRGGVASKMIKKLVEDNRGIIDAIHLEVNSQNERAKLFYLKNGFSFLNTKDDGSVIMERNIHF